MSLRNELEQRVSAWGEKNFPGLANELWVRACADERHGHFQTHLAMVAAKATRQNPRELAERLAGECPPPEGWDKPSVAGAGFVNYRVGPEALGRAVDALRKDPRLGIPSVSHPESIVIDFSSPNIAKAMHVGHIRSTLLGDSLARLLHKLGHRVTRVNHLGDWGTQFGKLLLAYRAAGRPPIETDHAIDQLEEFYKKGHQATEADPAAMEQARAELAALQNGDPERLRDWRLFCAQSAEHFRRIYERLGITFDAVRGESAYHEDLPGVVQELLDRQIAEVSQGAVVVRNSSISEEPYLVQKSDGAYLYATTDLAAIRYRTGVMKADRIIYVTDARQQLHFRWLFDTARRLDCRAELEHVWFGTILGPDRKPMKSRDGTPLRLTELLHEASERAAEILRNKRPDLAPKVLREKAELLGIASLKYADQLPNRNLDYVFTWEKLLAFDGNTAPYILNAYVRTRSILRKAGLNHPPEAAVKISQAEEEVLARLLLRFGDAVELATNDRRPHHLCGYLYELAGQYHRFFEACPVLQLPALRDSRLTLVFLTGEVLREGLSLLGIPTLEEM
ncbi:MAG: arginine--tRNA ligase [Verrucomicrobia bacterium]|nr:arginine--tRNA ligase [Verrucomicrobiota bacterium]NBR63158.1 arginine--tRNA ligase [Verrucomicrobiota bacterium]